MSENNSASKTIFWQRRSLLGKVAISIFIYPAVASVFIAIMFANIVPSPAAYKIEFALAIVYAIAFATFLEIANWHRDWDSNQKGETFLRKWWRRVPFLLCIGFMFGYTTFVWAYPWLLNKFIGKTQSVEYTITGWDGGGRGGCPHPNIGHVLFEDSPRAFCVAWSAVGKLTPGSQIRIVGPKSFLGINTDKIYIINPQRKIFQQLKAGKKAADQKDYAKAIKLWRPLAEKGNVTAQFDMGVLYFNGQGVPRDYPQAISWYRKAAEKRYAPAQANLGFMYDKGLGVAQNYKAAITWYRKAAKQGSAVAQLDMGYMYYSGKGTTKNIQLAKQWWQKAAAQHNSVAQKCLISLRKEGK